MSNIKPRGKHARPVLCPIPTASRASLIEQLLADWALDAPTVTAVLIGVESAVARAILAELYYRDCPLGTKGLGASITFNAENRQHVDWILNASSKNQRSGNSLVIFIIKLLSTNL